MSVAATADRELVPRVAGRAERGSKGTAIGPFGQAGIGRPGIGRSGIGRPGMGRPGPLRLAATLGAVLLITPILAAVSGAGADAAALRSAPEITKIHQNRKDGAAARAVGTDARAARAQIDAQLQRYQDAVTRENAGIAALTASFSAASDAEVSDDQAAAQLRRAQAVQTQQIRAMYAAGGPIGLVASVLDATSPQDALWRASTANQAAAGILDQTSAQVLTRADLATLTRRRVTAADAATQEQARALDVLQKRSALAQQALAAAQQTLADLNAAARAASAARAAAHEIAAAEATARAARRTAMGPVTALDIPAEYQRAYRAGATTCPGMRWTLLAGVGQVESGHGRNNGPSSAGAIGPMQFLPATFRAYAVDGDGDGVLDPLDPWDAIFTAAHYLCVSGADGGSPAGIHAALLTYNHAEWYVDLVLAAEQAIIARRAALGPR